MAKPQAKPRKRTISKRKASVPPVTPEVILRDLWAARNTYTLVAGIELDVFGAIARGHRTAQAIAHAGHASERGMSRLLDGLCALGYLAKTADKYSLTPVSKAFLVPGLPAYLGDMAVEVRLSGEPWTHLTEVVKKGRPYRKADAEAEGRNFFPKLAAAIFPLTFPGACVAAKTLMGNPRKPIVRVLDVASGSAAWSIPFAQASANVRVTALDYPEVMSVAREFTKRMGVDGQFEYVEGNLREVDLGSGFDLIILGHIIHVEGETWGQRLIERCHHALAPGGRLLIAEMVPDDQRTGPVLPVIFGLNMLVNTEHGNVFTMKQYRQWLKKAGFRRIERIEVPAPSPLIVATK